MLIASYVCFIFGFFLIILASGFTFLAGVFGVILFIVGAIIGYRNWVSHKKFSNFFPMFLNVCCVSVTLVIMIMLFLLSVIS